MREPLYARVIGWAIGALLICAAILLLMTVAGLGYQIITHLFLTTYPESTEDCPPQHVYIAHGETPQAGCWPEGVARQMGVYPEPEEPNGN